MSKEALERIQKKVHDTINVADAIQNNIIKQNDQIIRINQSVERMDSTMNRTKKYLAYFGKSFLRDKLVISLLILIFCTIGAIIGVACINGDTSDTGSSDSTTNSTTNSTTTAAYYIMD